ncbi:hypothetical protein [Romboutsia sp.]|uniref:hypothetical protein n=1 Tax=Romboutsia sp. TaxID=1965302 RepID=UPI003F2F3BF8
MDYKRLVLKIVPDILNSMGMWYLNSNHISETYDKQVAKGLAKYGHSLQDCPEDKFDWNIMALEELVDAAQYIIKFEEQEETAKYAVAELSYDDEGISMMLTSTSTNNYEFEGATQIFRVVYNPEERTTSVYGDGATPVKVFEFFEIGKLREFLIMLR